MSIVKAINELSGKEAVTIEDAIRNVELGGGGSSALMANLTIDSSKGTGMFDKTFGEIKQAVNNGSIVICKSDAEGLTMWFIAIAVAGPSDGGTVFLMGSGGTLYGFDAHTDSDYPSGTLSKRNFNEA